MDNVRKFGFIVLLSLMLFSTVTFGAHAQDSGAAPSTSSLPSGQVPAPDITSNPPSGSRSGCGITVASGDFDSNWYAEKGDGSSGNDLEGLYSNVQFNIGSSQMCFETQLCSSNNGGLGNLGLLPNDNAPYAITINCDGAAIPINLQNCASFDESKTDVVYVGNLPTFNNTFTFHDVALDTYGHGSSTVTVKFVQQFIANWSEMTIKMGADLDFTNMQLYSPVTQQPISPGTPFTLSLCYYVDMSNYTESQQVGHTVNFHPTVTANQIYYTGDNGFGYQYSLANMNFGDSYTEIQGAHSIPNLTPQAYFQQQVPGNMNNGGDNKKDNKVVPDNKTTDSTTDYQATGKNAVSLMADQTSGQDSDSCFVLCYQTFNGLTYGVTTGINSDPTIQINHNLVSKSSTLELIAIVAVIAAVAASVSVTLIVRRRRHQGKTTTA
jgi:hypothetical protein